MAVSVVIVVVVVVVVVRKWMWAFLPGKSVFEILAWSNICVRQWEIYKYVNLQLVFIACLLDWLIDYNAMSTILGSFYAKGLGIRILCMFIYTFLLSFFSEEFYFIFMIYQHRLWLLANKWFDDQWEKLHCLVLITFIFGASPRGVVANWTTTSKKASSNFSRVITFTFGLMAKGKAWTPLSSQLCLNCASTVFFFFFYKNGFGIKLPAKADIPSK